MDLTTSQLRIIMPLLPKARAAVFIPHLEAAMDRFGINTPLRAAAFLAQAAHESAQLSRLVENLNYGAKGLLATWPSRFTPTLAKAIERQPERIANYVYGGRNGNGLAASGDGWRFRGRGIFQLTFRGNYRRASALLGLPLEEQPDLVATPEVGSLTAGLFWHDNGLSAPADVGDLVTITRRINGGTKGIEERKVFYRKALVALGLAA